MANSNDKPRDGVRHDPHLAFCFGVVIEGLGVSDAKTHPAALFRSVSGLSSESEVVPYKEGGVNSTTHALVGPTKWPNIVLKKGFTADQTFINWRQEFLNDASGVKRRRFTGQIVQYDSTLTEVCHWEFKDGWPCKWEGPEFDATKSELSMESIEIAHEGLTFFMGGPKKG